MVVTTMDQDCMQSVIRTRCLFVLQILAKTNLFIEFKPWKINLCDYANIERTGHSSVIDLHSLTVINQCQVTIFTFLPVIEFD